jgi:hypothetical protein
VITVGAPLVINRASAAGQISLASSGSSATESTSTHVPRQALPAFPVLGPPTSFKSRRFLAVLLSQHSSIPPTLTAIQQTGTYWLQICTVAAMSPSEGTEPFPALDQASSAAALPPSGGTEQHEASVGRSRASSTASSIGRATRSRAASLRQSFINSNPPLGMWQATGEVGAKIPTLPEIKSGAFADEGWSQEGQMERRGSNPHEIQRRRIARTSSASQRRRKSTLTPSTPATIPEVLETSFSAQKTVAEHVSNEAAVVDTDDGDS